MNYDQSKILLTQLSGKVIAFHPVYAQITGSLNAGLFLSQALYWTRTPPTPDRDGWFYRTADQWKGDTYLSRKEQASVRKRLVDLGILEEDLRGIPATLWFRLNLDRIVDLVISQSDGDIYSSETSLAPKESPVFLQGENLGSSKGKTITENTAENTSREKNPPTPRKNNATQEWQDQAFEDIWDHYPRKNDKAGARREWMKLWPDGTLAHEILYAINNQKDSVQWGKDGGAYIPHFRTWLHNERWKDEVILGNPDKPTRKHGII